MEKTGTSFISSISIKNFTVFKDVKIDFSKGINFIIGDNSSGKTNLIKLLYSTTSYINIYEKNFIHTDKYKQDFFIHTYKDKQEYFIHTDKDKYIKEKILSNEILEIYKADEIKNLCKNGKLEISTEFKDSVDNIQFFEYSYSNENSDVITIETLEEYKIFPDSIFIPVKEVLSFSAGFIDFYENHESDFDKTYYNLIKALIRYPLKAESEKYKKVEHLLIPLRNILGGEIKLKGNKFYLIYENQKEREISLIAEGHRKIAMLYHLIKTDNLKEGSVLFWDEPDSSLNPRLIVPLAKVLVELSKFGIQIFITSHNLFFMNEMELLRKEDTSFPIKFFSLKKQEDEVVVEEGNEMIDLKTIDSLDEALRQDDREQELFIKEIK